MMVSGSSVVDRAVAGIRRHWTGVAQSALVLGTGLGEFARQVVAEAIIPFAEIPGIPTATALAHRGRVVCGQLHGVPLILLDGRCHLYEGYTLDEITIPVRVMHACGARRLIITNAGGGLNPLYSSGDVVVIEDHINLLGQQMKTAHSQTGKAWRQRCSRSPYRAELIEKAMWVARHENFVAHRGVYVAVVGPNYETRAEYRFLRSIGGDVVGMSTVPEALVAETLGMEVLGLSIVTNVARPDAHQPTDAGQVVDAAAKAEPNLRKIVTHVVKGP